MALKFRSPTTFTSRITAASGITLSTGFASGSDGTGLSAIYAGTVSACFLAMATGASAAGSAAVTGARAGDLVFLQSACTTGSAFITAASATGDNKVEFKTYNSSSGTSAASTVTLQYLVVRTGS